MSDILLLAGCTDEIQVVDAGFGALIKRHTNVVVQEWMQDDDNWAEWTGPNLSAGHHRLHRRRRRRHIVVVVTSLSSSWSHHRQTLGQVGREF